MGEVEAQPVGSHQRTGLHHVVAQVGAQLAVQQVGGRVVAADVGPPLVVHFQAHHLADLHLAADHLAAVDDQARRGPARVLDAHLAAKAVDDVARVADLAAGLDVEGRGRGDDFDRLAGVGHLHGAAVADQGQDSAVQRCAGIRVIVHPFFVQLAAGHQRQQQVAVDALADLVVGEGPAAAGQGVLLARRGVALLVDGHAVLFQRLVAGQFQRQAMGGVEAKGYVAGHDALAAAVEVVQDAVELEQAAIERAVEARLLALQGVEDQLAPQAKLG